MQPKQSDINAAMAFLRSRLNAELSMKNHLKAYIDKAVRMIVAISYKYATSPSMFSFSRNVSLLNEVSQVVEWLRSMIEDDMDTLAAYNENEEDKDDMLAMLKGEFKGKTFEDRFSGYIERFKDEIETAIAAGLILGMNQEDVISSILRNRRHPYDNRIIDTAIEEGGSTNETLSTGKKPNFGVGHTASSESGIEDLTRWVIATGWMSYYERKLIESGAIGFMSFRGSSYPCEQCDDETSYVHQFGVDPRPPYHNHCKCYIVPIYI